MSLDYNIALSGMSAAQKGIKVTQHNISNLNTEGYARQRVELKQSGVASGSGIMQKNGSGVILDDVKMITDQILLDNYNSQNSKVNYFNNIEEVLTEVETIYGDFTEGSLNKLSAKYFESWEELSKFPEENSYKYALMGESNRLVYKVNELGNEFSRIRTFTTDKADKQIEQINVLTETLSKINQKFNELGANAPNSLRNERDMVITKLSGYADIEVKFESTNKDVVSIRSGGAYLVDMEKSFDVNVVNDGENSFLTNGTTKIALSDGDLKASLDMVNKYLKSYEGQLEKFVSELKTKINNYHSSGFSINGDTGIDFFTGNDAKSFSVNSILVNDPTKIATTSVAGIAGNTDVAKKIANVVNEEVVQGMNFRDYVNSLTITMAQDLHDASTQVVIQEEVLSGMAEQKENVQGVNMEEEMTSLMMYQKFYGANAKALKIMDEMFDTVFQII